MRVLSYTQGSERKCTRAKHHGRLKQKWNSFDDDLKMAYWYRRIPPAHQVILLWYLRIAPIVQEFKEEWMILILIFTLMDLHVVESSMRFIPGKKNMVANQLSHQDEVIPAECYSIYFLGC